MINYRKWLNKLLCSKALFKSEPDFRKFYAHFKVAGSIFNLTQD